MLPVGCVVQVFRQNYHTNILSLNMFLCSFQFILQEVLSRNWLCVLTAKLHKRHESLMFLVSFHDFAFFIKAGENNDTCRQIRISSGKKVPHFFCLYILDLIFLFHDKNILPKTSFTCIIINFIASSSVLKDWKD